MRRCGGFATTVFAATILTGATAVTGAGNMQQAAIQVPTYRVDPAWPKPLPNRWLLGAVAGVAVDRRGHIWITHRPSTLQPNETRSIWKAAPPVLEFDAEGNVVSSWGGPGDGYEWPDLEHGIYVDTDDNVWLGGGGQKDAQILKFTRDGRFLLQIGRKGKGTGSNDTANLGGTANMVVDAAARELYVADGYVNHRVIVFDTVTGAYKRHWGAYGKRPDDSYFTDAAEKLPPPFSGAVQHENRPSNYDPDGPPAPQFRIVHAVRIANDGLVYVCDRTNDRVQVFSKNGTFVKEGFVRETHARQRIGVGHRVLNRSAAGVPDRAGRDQPAGVGAQARHARSGERLRSRRSLGGTVLRRPQHRRRCPRQPVRHRDLRGQAGAEVRLHGHGSGVAADSAGVTLRIHTVRLKPDTTKAASLWR